MQLKIFSIRDAKGETYNTPFFQKTHGEAERTFRELANDEKSMICKYPDDFDLYCVGEFDTETGNIISLPTPQHLIKGVNVKRPINAPEFAQAIPVNKDVLRPGANGLVHPGRQ